MKVKIMSRINAQRVSSSGQPPAWVVFNHVHKIITEEENLEIDYMVAEKIEMQQIKLPVDKLSEARIEF